LNPFEWAQISAEAHTRTLQDLADIKARATSEQATISKLQAQLDDFIKTKSETEKEMLQQFMVLLNEKKRKIRDQNRLLAGAKVNETTGKTKRFTCATTRLTGRCNFDSKEVKGRD
jgi:methionyl-tRNA synthetase